MADKRLKVVEGSEPVPQYIDAGIYSMSAHGLTFRVRKHKRKGQDEETITVSSAFEILGRVRDPKS